LLYEVKEGGERTGTFELFDVETRNRLSDRLPRGYLRGFSFAANAKSFYYVHEAIDSRRPFYRAAYEHVLGSLFSEDEEIFFAGEDQNIRLILLPGGTRLGFAVYRFLEKCFTDVYLAELDRERSVTALLRGVDCLLGPHLVDDRIFAITDRNAPNRRIVEIPRYTGGEHEWIDIVPEADDPIRRWFLVGDRIAVSYSQHLNQKVCLFTLSGNKIGEIPIRRDENVRMVGGSPSHGDLFLERESFLEPIAISCYEVTSGQETLWSRKQVPFDASRYGHAQIWYTSSDGTRIPMFLVGRQDILAKSDSPTIMTSYGGFGSSMTPQFSVFVAFLIERGCLFALPNIRGGSEFGAEWHIAAKRRKRQTAYDDFLCAAESLIGTGRTDPKRLAIFGGSNSGLLVGAALTQRPDLFRAVVCMVPLLDMLRYHLYDNAHIWKEEFGTADLLEDFETLSRYSPYHRVRDGVKYPAVMLVSGDADRNCNPLHARKMTARLQAASASLNPIFLDYSEFRGHSPVLPLSQRIDALTDRMAFLCDQLQLEV
jgi:prolyl oligopeptidase